MLMALKPFMVTLEVVEYLTALTLSCKHTSLWQQIHKEEKVLML